MSFSALENLLPYDPEGAWRDWPTQRGHLTKTYQYNVTGELTYGSAAYENEYTYNGESYNPNIHSQYLRARYYCVVTANFLTEDSYLGNIREPLTLNRYNYCISSYLNYVDPSGNVSLPGPVIPSILSPFGDAAKEVTWEDLKQKGQKIWDSAASMKGTVDSYGNGVLGSVAKAVLDKPAVSMMPWASLVENTHNAIQELLLPDSLLRDSSIPDNKWHFTSDLKNYISKTETPIRNLAGDVEDINAYYIGRCAGDVVVFGIGLWETLYGLFTSGTGGAALALEAASGAGLVLAPETVAVVIGGIIISIDGAMEAAYGLEMFRQDLGRYQESKKETESEEDTGLKGDSDSKISQKALDALERIDKDPKGYLEDYYGGVEFKDKPNTKLGETKIPNENITNYVEYDINPYKYGKPRGTERVVVGQDGSAWYTPDHYKTWYRIR